jgi:uncharacterized protein
MPATIGPSDYAWFSTQVKTVAVQAVLISLDFSQRSTPYYRERCEQLSQLGKIIRDHLSSFKQYGHPKWQEVNLDKEIILWKRDRCSQMVGPRFSPRQDDLEKELRAILTKPK